MRFKKVYVEITNVCNFNCSFCYRSKRKKEFVSSENFSAILSFIKPYTNYIYLHVLGEPLAHPQLDELLKIAEDKGFFVNITTNGYLIPKKRKVLEQHSVRQYNISLHDAEENIGKENWTNYLDNVVDFAVSQSEKSYISLRLWNGGASSDEFNQVCRDYLQRRFSIPINLEEKNLKLMDHLFLQRNSRFDWPVEEGGTQERRKCYAMRDQVAILVDGTVVPCCLDADAHIRLGNVFEEDFGTIINNDRACNIAEGFRNQQAVEPFCKGCGFVMP